MVIGRETTTFGYKRGPGSLIKGCRNLLWINKIVDMNIKKKYLMELCN